MSIDIERRRKRIREWKRSHTEKTHAQYREYNDKLKRDAIFKLGGRCVAFGLPLCGISEIDVLQIDHKVPIGRVQNFKFKSNREFWRAIIAETIDVSNLQVLCANCHSRKTMWERRHPNGY